MKTTSANKTYKAATPPYSKAVRVNKIHKINRLLASMRSLLVLLLLTPLNSGCKSAKAQEQCLVQYLSEVETTPEYSSLLHITQDTISKWINWDVKFFGHLSTDSEWLIDSTVFFNENRTKALLLLLVIDKRQEAKLDNVQMLAAERLNGAWHIYAQSMPVIYYDRKQNQHGRAYSFKELSEQSRQELIKGGFYKKGTCKVNYDYVNDWFKDPLGEFHKKYFFKEASKN